MHIEVVLFGAVADLARRRKLAIELPERSTVSDGLENLSETLSTSRGGKLLYAVNEEYADGETQLRDGDTLAIFTAVSGG